MQSFHNLQRGSSMFRSRVFSSRPPALTPKPCSWTGWHAQWGSADDNSNFIQSPYGRAWAKPDGANYGVQASGLAIADSEGWRSAFRTDVDHDSEVMPISVPI